MSDPSLPAPADQVLGRYELLAPHQAQPAWTRWSARDLSLGRAVTLLTFPADAPHAAAALDAARRAAGVDEPRLTRVLDAGSDTRLGVVVEEVTDGLTLEQVLTQRTLPAEEARRVIGELAAALAVAETRGLHHLALRPDGVLLLADGSVKLRGLATEAALLGRDETTRTPGRVDARALIALLYAALTRTWVPDLESAEPLAPIGVAEFDALVQAARGAGDPGRDDPSGFRPPTASPPNAAAVAATLRPWAASPLLDYPGITEQLSSRRAGAGQGTAPADPVADSSADPTSDSRPPAAVRNATSDDPAAPQARNDPRPAAASSADLAPAAPSAAPTVAVPAAPVIPDRPTPPNPPLVDPGQPRHPGQPDHDVRLSEVLVASAEPLEPPTPTVLADRLGAVPERPDARLAMLIVGGLVLLFALLGIWGLPRLGGIDPSGGAPPTPTTNRSGSNASAGTGSATPTGSPSGGGLVGDLSRIRIVRGASYEPEGDGEISSQSATQAWDGKTDTAWRSNKWYATERFGGLKRTGYGLIAHFDQAVPVRRVVVTVPVAQDLTVYVADQPSVTGATKIGTSTGATGELVFEVPDGIPVTGRLVIVFVTKLGPESAGKFRAQISELVVSG